MAVSGLNINLSKSSIWFSPNTPANIRSQTSISLGIRETALPGQYLGIPLGVLGKKKDFDCVLEKIKSKITSWKGKYLSQMGKAVLIRSVCSAISAFYMQCLPIPKGVCAEIDKCIRTFFWEELGGKQKLHLINWSTITTPVDEGGLGFYDSYLRNQAFLGKLFWRMVHENSAPWAIISSHRFEMKAKNSVTYKCLSRGKMVFDLGTKHVIHSGQQTSFWFDKWLPQGSIRSLIEGPLMNHDRLFKVADALDTSGNWIWSNISFPLPHALIQSMLSTPRNPLGGRDDVICWSYKIDGTFSLKSAYDILSRKNQNTRINIKWIWKTQCHPRHKFFCWLIWHHSLPTNFLLHSWNIDTSPTCSLCGLHDESVEHMFRSCPTTNLIWRLCINPPSILFSSQPFQDWFRSCASLQYSFWNILHLLHLELMAGQKQESVSICTNFSKCNL